MSSSPFISVIIPSFNRAHVLPATIESILAQTYKDFELIIVDDGSTDNTAEVVSRYGDAVQLIRQENKGITGARNTGLHASKGQWIALQDSDDHWEPEKLEQQVSDIEEHPGLNVYFVETILQRTHLGRDVLFFEHSGFSAHLNEGFTVIERPLYHQVKYGVAWVQCTLVRREAIFDAGLYDESLTIFTDVDMFCRLALLGKWGFNRTPLVRIQRVVGEAAYVSSQRTRTPEKAYRTMARIMRKLQETAEMDERELETVRLKLYGALSGCGNALLAGGDVAGARDCFREALRVHAKPGALAKWLLCGFKATVGTTPRNPVGVEK